MSLYLSRNRRYTLKNTGVLMIKKWKELATIVHIHLRLYLCKQRWKELWTLLLCPICNWRSLVKGGSTVWGTRDRRPSGKNMHDTMQRSPSSTKDLQSIIRGNHVCDLQSPLETFRVFPRSLVENLDLHSLRMSVRTPHERRTQTQDN